MQKRKTKYYLFVILSICLLAYPLISLASNEKIEINGSVDKGENAIDLEWLEPDKDEPYTYQLFQKREGSSEFQSISTVDLDNGRIIRVLNVFPSNHVTEANLIPEKETEELDLAGKPLLKSAMLKEWIGEYGREKIHVDAINQNDFDINPNKYLKDNSGSYCYDVVVVGFWNINAQQNQFLGDNGVEALREFAESGRGLLTGHHHLALRELDKGMNKLKDLFGVKFIGETGWNQYRDTYYNQPVKLDYTGPEISTSPHSSRYWSESDKLVAVRTGLLFEYPNYVAEEGRVFDVPLTHNGGDFVTGDVWLEFKDPYAKGYPNQSPIILNELPNGTKGSNSAYLSTFNNTALIQIGHSSLTNRGKDLASTEDEKKLVANTVFYLAQLTTETSHKDRSGMDITAPNPVTDVFYNPINRTAHFSIPHDIGTTYTYYVEATGTNTGVKKRSQEITVENKSGILGYSYIVDNHPHTVPSKEVNTSEPFIQLNNDQTGRYLHIVAVDAAGNVSKPVHYDLLENSSLITITPSTTEWTNQPVQLSIQAPYVYGVMLPHGGIVTQSSFSFDATNNGSYTFIAIDQEQNVLDLVSYIVSNIDRIGKEAMILPNDKKWSNQNIPVEIKEVPHVKK